MNNKRKVSLTWLQLQKMQGQVCLQKELDKMIHHSSVKTTIQSHSGSKTYIKHRPRNLRINTDGIMIKNVLNHEIWNPLIRLRYQSPQTIRWSQEPNSKFRNKVKNQTFIGLDLLNRKSNQSTTFIRPQQKHIKSLAEMKQQLMPFFDDLTLKKKKKRTNFERRDNLTAFESKELHRKQCPVGKNIGAFKIHQIEWRKRPKPTFQHQKLFQVDVE